jgi:hypothetical protein
MLQPSEDIEMTHVTPQAANNKDIPNLTFSFPSNNKTFGKHSAFCSGHWPAPTSRSHFKKALTRNL